MSGWNYRGKSTSKRVLNKINCDENINLKSKSIFYENLTNLWKMQYIAAKVKIYVNPTLQFWLTFFEQLKETICEVQIELKSIVSFTFINVSMVGI